MEATDFESLGIIWSLAFAAVSATFGEGLRAIGGPATEVESPSGDFWPFGLAGDVTGEGGASLPAPFLRAVGRSAPELLEALAGALADVLGCHLEVSVGEKADAGQGSYVATPVHVGEGKKSFDVSVYLRPELARRILDAFGAGVGAEDDGTPAIADAAGEDQADTIRPVRWPSFVEGDDEARGPLPNLELFYDVPLTLTAELGRVERRVEDVMGMGPGAVVELDRTVGEAVDILANGQWIARGEVVVVEENFGVRITEIGTTQERATKLRLREGS